MPKVKLSPDYSKTKLQRLIFGRMRELNKTGKDLSNVWGVSQQMANKRIRDMRMDWSDLVTLIRFLKIDPNEIVEVLR